MLKKDSKVYMCIVVPNCNIYDVLELTLRTVEDSWAVGVDEHTRQAQIFSYNMLGKYVFENHRDALQAILGFREAGESANVI